MQRPRAIWKQGFLCKAFRRARTAREWGPLIRVGAGTGLWALLALPFAQTVLEATMMRHMLVQIPLLMLAGGLVAGRVPARMRTALASWNALGITGLLLASSVAMFWMIPLVLDAALSEPAFVWAKFLGVPLLVGVPFALSWPRANFIVRSVFWIEAIAVLFRAGWLYLASPVRLCSNYSLDDQQQLGALLLWCGLAAVLLGAGHLFFGHPRVGRPSKD